MELDFQEIDNQIKYLTEDIPGLSISYLTDGTSIKFTWTFCGAESDWYDTPLEAFRDFVKWLIQSREYYWQKAEDVFIF